MTHTLVVLAAGTSGILLLMGGVRVALRPRRLWERWFAIELRFRRQRFGGGGTHVARRLGRRFIGIELAAAYAKMARDKVSKWWDPPNLAPRPVPDGQGALL